MQTLEDAARRPPADAGAGLDEGAARERLVLHGPNELPMPRRDGWPRRLVELTIEPMALLLLAAAAVAGLGLGEPLNGVAILSIVFLNATIGLLQEGKAARAMEALRAMGSPTARVLRSGHLNEVAAREVVPGDVLVIEAGDRVPADVLLLEASSLEIDESLLTGESLPVRKEPSSFSDEPVGLADRRWMAHAGTIVTRGAARGLVTATGAHTEIGRIAERLRAPEPPTPLQVELSRLTARLGTIAVVIALAVFGLTLLRLGTTGEGLQRAFLSAVALAVAAVPEGMATVVTVALALGVRRMAAEGAIIRRLPAVETLGSTTVIATDKTGTLTLNRMRLASVTVDGESGPAEALAPHLLERLARVAVLCNDATLDPPTGDPLDVALLEGFAAATGGPAGDLRDAFPRIATVPFDSKLARMTTSHRAADARLMLVKGAPEVVLELCAAELDADGQLRALTAGGRQAVLTAADRMAAGGMRVLALAERTVEEDQAPEAEEHGMTLVGLVGLRDPVRPEAADTVARARAAGVHVLLVTGDHPATAASVASEVGLLEADGAIITGTDVRDLGLPTEPLAATVYARVDPDQKLALVQALKEAGYTVAVTGDGVNDAAAMRGADIGVAMGRGSDVAREAADLVVTDDDLATIVTAIREGRGIYDNIRKVVDYLVGGNLSEIAVVVGCLLLFPALGVPLLPLQLLWINLLTDGLPALALGIDGADPGLMRRGPRRPDERLLGGRHTVMLSGRALLIAGSSVGALTVSRYGFGEPWTRARATMFTVLVTAHLLYAFAVRGRARGMFRNRWLVGSVLTGIGLQFTVVAWPLAHHLFGTTTLGVSGWALVLVAGALPPALMLALQRAPRRLRAQDQAERWRPTHLR